MWVKRFDVGFVANASPTLDGFSIRPNNMMWNTCKATNHGTIVVGNAPAFKVERAHAISVSLTQRVVLLDRDHGVSLVQNGLLHVFVQGAETPSQVKHFDQRVKL
jgi:hypothetical protein